MTGVDSATSSVGPVLLIVACFVSTSVCISLEPAPKTQHADGAVSQGIICVPKKTDDELFVIFTIFWPESNTYGRGQVSPRPPQLFGTKKIASIIVESVMGPPSLAQCVAIW